MAFQSGVRRRYLVPLYVTEAVDWDIAELDKNLMAGPDCRLMTTMTGQEQCNETWHLAHIMNRQSGRFKTWKLVRLGSFKTVCDRISSRGLTIHNQPHPLF